MGHDTSSTWVHGLLDMFESQGLRGAALLEAAGIPEVRLNDRGARFQPDEVSRLWELAVSASRNEVLGIDRELAARHMDFDDVAFAMVACSDLRNGLRELLRFLDLVSSATAISLAECSDGAWLSLGHVGTTRPVPWQRSAYSLLAVLAMCRWLVRRDVRPLSVEVGFPWGSMTANEACQKAFGAPITYGAPMHRFLLSAEDLASPVPSQNSALLILHERIIEQRLAGLSSKASLRSRVSEAIGAMLIRGTPTRVKVAVQLSMTERALQRGLKQQQTNYQRVLDDTRRDIARTLLADERPICQVVHMLGFKDESNFFRACKRWYGSTPSKLRSKELSS